MRRKTRLLLLMTIAGVTSAGLIACLAVPGLLRDPHPPADVVGRIRWMGSHPADWLRASMVADTVLDSNLARRSQIWQSSFEMARRLAPFRPNPPLAFLRAGFFHWYELTAGERAKVLEVAAPLLRDYRYFERLHQPIFQLTHDLGWLRRHSPPVLGNQLALQAIAIRYGLFDDYRSLREEIRKSRIQALEQLPANASVEQLMGIVPQRIDKADTPLVARLMAELARRGFNADQLRGIDPLVLFAIRNELSLDPLRPLLDAPKVLRDVTRARTAVALGDVSLANQFEMASAVAGDPQWVPYYLERAHYDAEHGAARDSELRLQKAAMAGPSAEVLAATVSIKSRLGDVIDAERARRLLQRRDAKPSWESTCGADLCDTARASVYLSGPNDALIIRLSTAQSDETPPYVELFVDDELTAEGIVGDHRELHVTNRPAGIHRLELRLVNQRARNGVQRRVAVS